MNSNLSEIEETVLHLQDILNELKSSPITIDIKNAKWLNYTAEQQKKVYEKTASDIKDVNVKMLKHVHEQTDEMMTKIDEALDQQKKISFFKIISIYTFQIISIAFLLFLFFNVLSNGVWQGLGLAQLWAYGTWWTYALAVIILIGVLVATFYIIIKGVGEIYVKYFW